jgi:hypothetical protein
MCGFMIRRKINSAIWVSMLLLLFSCSEPERTNILYSQLTPVSATIVTIHSQIIETEENLQVAVYGLSWSSSATPTNRDNVLTGAASLTERRFQLELSSLDRKKQYHVRAFITNNRGEIFYGNEVIFINDFLPEMINTRISEYKENGLRITTSLNNTGTLSFEEIGHVWSTSPSPTIDDNRSIVSDAPSGGEEFESELTGLEKATLYYVRPYAISGQVATYGKQIVGLVPDRIIAGKWEYISMPDLPQYFTNTLSINDDVYFFGGFDRYLLDPEMSEPTPLKAIFRLPYENIGNGDSQPTYIGQTPFIDASHTFVSGSSAFFYSDNWSGMMEYNTDERQWTEKAGLAGDVQFMASDGGDGYAAVMPEAGVCSFYRYSTAIDEWSLIQSHLFDSNTLKQPVIMDGVLYFISGENRFYSMNLVSTEVTLMPEFIKPPNLLFEYNSTLYNISGNEVFHYDFTSGSWQKNSRAPIEPLAEDMIPAFLKLKGGTYVAIFYPEYKWYSEFEFSNLMLQYTE